MKKTPLVISLGCAVTFTGCKLTTEVRASNRAIQSASESELVLPMHVPDAEKVIAEAFSKRGFPLIDLRPAVGSPAVETFKGRRTSVTSVSGGRHYVSSYTEDFGSVFYVRFTSSGDRTVVDFLGKPTINGREACSSHDAEFGVTCAAFEMFNGWQGWTLTTGRDEADTIQGISAELKLNVAGVEQPSFPDPVPAAPAVHTMAEPNCHLEQTPGWTSASAVEKKKMLDDCRAHAAPDRPAATSN